MPDVNQLTQALSEVVDVLRGHEELLRRLGVMEERLRQAMERESSLNEQLSVMKASLAEAEERVRQMKDHPAVRAAERQRIEAQVIDLQRRLDELEEPPGDSGEETHGGSGDD